MSFISILHMVETLELRNEKHFLYYPRIFHFQCPLLHQIPTWLHIPSAWKTPLTVFVVKIFWLLFVWKSCVFSQWFKDAPPLSPSCIASDKTCSQSILFLFLGCCSSLFFSNLTISCLMSFSSCSFCLKFKILVSICFPCKLNFGDFPPLFLQIYYVSPLSSPLKTPFIIW